MIVISAPMLCAILWGLVLGRCVVSPMLEAWSKNMNNPHRHKAPVKPAKPRPSRKSKIVTLTVMGLILGSMATFYIAVAIACR
jgi:hypothetical protein